MHGQEGTQLCFLLSALRALHPTEGGSFIHSLLDLPMVVTVANLLILS